MFRPMKKRGDKLRLRELGVMVARLVGRKAGRFVALVAILAPFALSDCLSAPLIAQPSTAGQPDKRATDNCEPAVPIARLGLPVGAQSDLNPPSKSGDAYPVNVVDQAPQERVENKADAPAKPSIKLRGRINADAINVSQSARDKAIIGDVQNATGFRRARLGAEGTVGDQVDWVAEFDFAGGGVSFKDVYVGVAELPFIRRFRIGHLVEPFSLEGYTSSNYFTFIERSSANSLDPGRNWGAGILAYTEDERLTCAAGAFRSGTGSNGNDIGDGNDMAYTSRLTGLPWYASEGRFLMHLGGAFSQRFPAKDVVTINQGPQSSLLTASDNPGSPFTPTITIPANGQQLYNLQWALVLGPLSFQAEWSGTGVDQIGGRPVFLHGCYAFVSYFLTGETRAYLTQDGKFGRTRVLTPFLCLKNGANQISGPGAWELTARFDYADFASPNIPLNAQGLRVGDTETVLSLGLNWYLNDYARLMFNYIHAIPVDPNFGPSYADAFFLRTAIFW
jgi:phosphate-selective porin OprO/OprP